MNKKRTNAIKKIKQYDWQEFFSSLLWAIIIALIFRTFLFEPYKIPSGSMIPTLKVGDYLFASKYSYGFSSHSFLFGYPKFNGRILFQSPEHGDIIIFKGVKDPDTYYIKRLVGLPGDVIQVKKGVLHINDVAVKREEIGTFVRYGKHGEHKHYDEILETMPNGKHYSTLDANINRHNDFPDTTKPYTVPAKHYFFMGDNRNNSIDSRYLNDIGYVPEDRLVAKAQFLLIGDDFSIIDLITKFKIGRSLSFIH